jgi:hypothetical protein
VGVTVDIGDRWIAGPEPRADRVVVGASVTGTMGKAAETRMVSGRASAIDLDWTAAGGTVKFAGLIHDSRYADAVGDPIDLAGTITWVCS